MHLENREAEVVIVESPDGIRSVIVTGDCLCEVVPIDVAGAGIDAQGAWHSTELYGVDVGVTRHRGPERFLRPGCEVVVDEDSAWPGEGVEASRFMSISRATIPSSGAPIPKSSNVPSARS